MKETLGLGAFLDDLSKDGNFKEQLTFSLDQAKAVQKLSESQLPEPGLWIVKMVQAAVASGASEVDIKLGRNRVEITFDTNLALSALELFELVISGALPAESALLHLVTGVRSSFAGPGVSFLLQTRGPTGRELVALSEGDSYHYQDAQKSSDVTSLSYVILRPYRMLSLKKALHKPVRRLLKGTAEEHSELVARCWPSPIPIRIDGRHLDTRYDSPLIHNENPSLTTRYFDWHGRRHLPRINLYTRFLAAENGAPTLPIPNLSSNECSNIERDGHELVLKRPVFLDETFIEWPCSGPPGAILLRPVGILRTGVLCFVFDGVVVQRAEMYFEKPGFEVFGKRVKMLAHGSECCIIPVSANDIDLSQFAVRDAEQKAKATLRKLLPLKQESEDVVNQLIWKLLFIPSNRSKAKAALGLAAVATIPVGLSFGMTAVGGYLAAQTFYATLFAGLNTGIFAASHRLDHKKKLKKREEHPVESIEQPPITP